MFDIPSIEFSAIPSVFDTIVFDTTNGNVSNILRHGTRTPQQLKISVCTATYYNFFIHSKYYKKRKNIVFDSAIAEIILNAFHQMIRSLL